MPRAPIDLPIANTVEEYDEGDAPISPDWLDSAKQPPLWHFSIRQLPDKDIEHLTQDSPLKVRVEIYRCRNRGRDVIVTVPPDAADIPEPAKFKAAGWSKALYWLMRMTHDDGGAYIRLSDKGDTIDTGGHDLGHYAVTKEGEAALRRNATPRKQAGSKSKPKAGGFIAQIEASEAAQENWDNEDDNVDWGVDEPERQEVKQDPLIDGGAAGTTADEKRMSAKHRAAAREKEAERRKLKMDPS